MNTSEVLYRAADHIERYGHHKGWSHADPNNTASASCVHGGIDAVTRCVSSDQRPAQDAVRAYIGTYMIGDWNDHPDRTAAEVIETLRACAVIESAKESARESGLNASADALGRGVRV